MLPVVVVEPGDDLTMRFLQGQVSLFTDPRTWRQADHPNVVAPHHLRWFERAVNDHQFAMRPCLTVETPQEPRHKRWSSFRYTKAAHERSLHRIHVIPYF